MQVDMTVNGQDRSADVEARTLLVYYLRDAVGLTGTNVGCDTSSCGACTVLLDGESVKSCTILAAQVRGADVTTIEGLADGTTLHPMQQAFMECHGLQCGYCTPGMVLAATSLLADNPSLARSIRNRFAYLDPLHHQQVALLRRHRAGDTGELVQRGIHLTINGIATGLRNSG